MYKVVIIDDEPIIVEGFPGWFRGGNISQCVSACAYSGRGRAGSHKKRETGYYFFLFFHAGT